MTSTPPPKNSKALQAALATALAAIQQVAASLEGAEQDPWLDLKSAAEGYPIGVPTLRQWARRGRLRSCAAERGRIIFRRSWLDAAIEACNYEPRPPIHKVPADASLEQWEAEAERAIGGTR